MTGVVAVLAEAPPLRRAGKLGVVIDGQRVGEVRQGEIAQFSVEPGSHTVRVGSGGSRSNTLTVAVHDGATCRVVNSSTGLGTAAAIVPLLGVVMALIPGVVFRLRVHDPRPASAPAPGSREDGAATGGSVGLWWESDPVLAKRYRKASAPEARK
ncbi:hypothetical protein [Streptomyces sp. NBC_01190]|uniref:hypothetical protein n=1 Tax=Streptomyces sp. NBC_01190 TaxID=2903767 RepID=UPI0038667C06|nr:hypothetical protein OG519_11510 [Streptomyces sp. NBC_01190]